MFVKTEGYILTPFQNRSSITHCAMWYRSLFRR